MPIVLYRVDDRLIHGQVVVGWGQPLGAGFIVLVDDGVADCDWEQELYRMGVPPGMDVYFTTVANAVAEHAAYMGDPRPGIVLTGDVGAMKRLVDGVPGIRAVNVGGIHHRVGRTERLRYVFLTPEEAAVLRLIAQRGAVVTARDVPSARAVPLDELLGDAA